MEKQKKILICFLASAIMSGCNNSAKNTTSDQETVAAVQTAAIVESAAEPEVDEIEEPVNVRETDRIVYEWLYKYLKDSEEFSDMEEYQYYARTLGLDKDYFLNPAVWEVFYNANININNEIDGKEIYLIRINPYVLLDIYASNNDCSVDNICDSLSCSKEQLYYNWGYNPSWRNYEKNHESLDVFLSEKEINIFGASNSEDRITVMNTHMLTVDTTDNNICTYSSSVNNRIKIKRMDLLNAISKESNVYSSYTENEKSASFTVNGIGIRAVIPLSLTNAWIRAEETDKNITPFINVSPFAYGCTDSDKINMNEYLIMETEE